jgi:hypothetical protein
MALVLVDRVKETTTTTGTGTVTLAGASTGYQSFAAIGDANTTYYVIAGQTTSEWEVGIGTYTLSGTTLARTTVLASSNAGSLVTFSAGTKDVWCDYSAAKAVTTDTLASPPAIGATTANTGAFTTLTASSTVSFTATTQTIGLGASQTTGTWTAGGTAQTGILTLGRSTAAQTVNVATGATATATTKTLNIGTAGVSGSTTNIAIGSAVSGSLGTTTIQAPTVNIGQTATQLSVTNTASAVNYAQVTGAITGAAPVLSVAGSDTDISLTLTPKGAGSVVVASASVGVGTTTPTSGIQTAGSSSKSAFKTPNIAEVNTISATAATGTINYDITTQSVLYYTTSASGNFTVNFRGSSGTSLNTLMQTGESISATFLVTNGATAYYNSAVTVDGNSVTPKWQGGTAPTSGNASSIDSYTYVIIKTGSAAFTILAAQTKFA